MLVRRIARMTLPRERRRSASSRGGDLVQFLNQGCFDFLTARVALLIVETVVRPKLTSKNSTRCLVMAGFASRVFDMKDGV